eukprot:m.16059 g.16059  ORF g.16059 m.16059 type:complete len:195 (-) comp6808_c0_seq1:38-622(-)
MAARPSVIPPGTAALASEDPMYQAAMHGSQPGLMAGAAAAQPRMPMQQMPKLRDQVREQNLQQEAATAVLSRARLGELVKEIDPTQSLDNDVEDALIEIANDFIEKAVSASCQLAKHRGSTTLEAKDVMLHLERNWNLRVPGFFRDEIHAARPPKAVESVKKTMAAIQKDSASNAPRRRRVEFRREGDGAGPAE